MYNKPVCTVLLYTYHHQVGESGFLAFSCDGAQSRYSLFGPMKGSWDIVSHLARLDAEYDLILGIIEVRSCVERSCGPCSNAYTRARYYSRKDLP